MLMATLVDVLYTQFLKQYTCGVSYQKTANYLQKPPNKKQKTASQLITSIFMFKNLLMNWITSLCFTVLS